MSTEKQKSKSTIITITVLSVLLALAVTATIVLAAFQASKNGNVTITFGSGLTLTMSGDVDGGNVDASTATFAITKNNLTSAGNIVSTVSATPSTTAFIAYKVATPSVTSGFTVADAVIDAEQHTITYAITKTSESEVVANLVITYNTSLSVIESNVVLYTAASTNSATDLFTSIAVNMTGDYTVDNIASLSISNLAITLGATTVDESGDASTALAACKIADPTVSSLS